jgi:ABC-type dipeptide/oligopeptide/nickel transport system permease component
MSRTQFRFISFILRRILQAIPLVLVIITINFFLIHLAPGDPVDILAGEMMANPEYAQQLRSEFGLDQPLLVQLGRFISKLVRFDLGYSLRYRQDVFNLILGRLPPTLLLMGTSLVFSSFIGILLGTIAAYRPYSLIDNAATLMALAGYSMPVFWLGQVLLIAFALELGWFPMQGMVSLRVSSVGWTRVLDILHHLVLPAVTFTVYHLTLIFRLTRVKMQEVLAMDFVTTARAKGLPERYVVIRHALRNAMLPVVTVVGLHFGFMLAGSVLVETVFAWPGMGRLMFEAIMARDYPVLMGLFFCVSVMVILANVLTDIVYAIIDPRVAYR